MREVSALEMVADLVRQLEHRGPDGTGVAGGAHTALGMSWLRVRSAPAEMIPFTDRRGSTFAFNGEVYKDGRTYPSGGLEEAMCAFAAAGHQGAVDGMYAIVGDAGDEALQLARDPFGIKPLYVRESPSGVAAASEMPPLIRVFGPPPIRTEAFAQFLLTGRRILDGGTFFEEIRPVAPGECVSIRSGSVSRSETFEPTRPVRPRPREPADLRAALEDAVDRTCLAERHLGLAISGGLDSTILASILARRGTRGLRTVSVVPDGSDDGVRNLDDLGLTDSAIDTWHHDWTSFGPPDLLSGLPAVVRTYGEPVAMTSAPMYAALARLARDNNITVLLVGEGADELFGGYNRYQTSYAGNLANPIDFYVSEERRMLVTELIGPTACASALDALRKALSRAQLTAEQRHSVAPTPADVVREFELEHSLEPLLRRTDHLLMAEGIEGRTPFLHADVPLLAQRIPSTSLVRGTQTKAALRDAFGDILPDRYRSHPKRPFRAPVSQWLAGHLLPVVDRKLAAGAGMLRERLGVMPEGLRSLRARLARGDEPTFTTAFALLATIEWLCWLDRMTAPGGAEIHGDR